MTGSLLPVPGLRAVDANGLPMPGALLQFYLTSTVTPTPVYTSAALTTPLPPPSSRLHRPLPADLPRSDDHLPGAAEDRRWLAGERQRSGRRALSQSRRFDHRGDAR